MWFEKYIGLKYSDYNCAEISQLILKQEFDHNLVLPQMPKTAPFMHKMIQEQKLLYSKSDKALDGSIVIMRQNGRMSHMGIACYFKSNLHVIHAVESFKMSVLTRESNLSRIAMKIMEFREWRI